MGLAGFILAGLVWLTAVGRLGQDRANVEAAATLLAFVGASVMMRRERGVRVAMIHRSHRVVLNSLGMGLRVGLPLAIMGGAYLFLTDMVTTERDLVMSAWWAVQPAIVGEVVFRFFILNTCLALLADRPARMSLIVGIYVLAIVPYTPASNTRHVGQ